MLSGPFRRSCHCLVFASSTFTVTVNVAIASPSPTAADSNVIYQARCSIVPHHSRTLPPCLPRLSSAIQIFAGPSARACLI